ncbi:MAG: hypothetical protein IT359_15155 [Gemmatimonadaceae bacterium]|nr:hypothetical protein [Gemmatimonadaceae bacterium]
MTAARWRDDAQAIAEWLRPHTGAQAVVAFQGERGAYGHLAIERLWGARASAMPLRSFADVIGAVRLGTAGYALLPVHNEIIGEIAGVRSAIARAGLDMLGEVQQPVRHCLLGVPGARLEAVTGVFSHPAALAQCRDFLGRHRGMVACESYDTAGAAREVAARGLRHEAAIASDACVARYGLQLLARDIGDRDDNVTTFAVVRGVR